MAMKEVGVWRNCLDLFHLRELVREVTWKQWDLLTEEITWTESTQLEY